MQVISVALSMLLVRQKKEPGHHSQQGLALGGWLGSKKKTCLVGLSGSAGHSGCSLEACRISPTRGHQAGLHEASGPRSFVLSCPMRGHQLMPPPT